MKRLILFFGLISFSIISCTSPKEDNGFVVAPTRIPYKYHVEADGPPPKKGDVVVFEWKLEDDDGNAIPSPVMEGMPTAHVLNGSGLLTYRADPILGQATVGDSLTIRMTTGMLYRTYGMPKGMSSNEWINCHLKITGILGLSAYQRKEASILTALREKRALQNDSLIRRTLTELEIDAKRTENGVYYLITENGQGRRVQNEDQLKFHYRVYLLDGTLVDESYKRGEPFEVVVGRGEIIDGLDSLFPQLRVGDKATVFIPSDLAYGEKRMGNAIPPNANLKFEVSMEEVK